MTVEHIHKGCRSLVALIVSKFSLSVTGASATVIYAQAMVFVLWSWKPNQVRGRFLIIVSLCVCSGPQQIGLFLTLESSGREPLTSSDSGCGQIQ